MLKGRIRFPIINKRISKKMSLTMVVICIGVFGVAIYYNHIKKNSDVRVDARTWSKLSWRSTK